MPFARRFEGSPYALTKDTASPAKDFVVKIDNVLGATVLTATTCRVFVSTGTYVDVTATAAEVLAVIDPALSTPIVTPPANGDPTGGKLRINPQGGVIAYEQNGPLGKWLVVHVNNANEPQFLYTDDTKNPEIGAWPFLQKKV